MTPVPDIHPLPQRHRKFVFISALLVFIIAVPAFVFYAVGYRFDFSEDTRSIRSVGGMYISADAQETEIYIDDEPVEDMRIFQRAAYIQNLTEGSHQVHVQGEGVQTWVKELPVFSHYVTEASSFNMPLVPQVRVITEYQTADAVPVLFTAASSTPLATASSTQTLYIATTTATSTFDVNPEYPYIKSRFASSTAEKQALAKQRELLEERFLFSDEAARATSAVATTTKTYRDTRLYEHNNEVFIEWTGPDDSIPYYYCVRYEDATTTAALYGAHVDMQLHEQYATVLTAEGDYVTATEMRGERWCRDQIKIDSLRQEVLWFDYYPNSADLILMHLTDGLYVVEVDDRAWQNTQPLYPGAGIEVIRDGDRIFVADDGYYFEIFTELSEI